MGEQTGTLASDLRVPSVDAGQFFGVTTTDPVANDAWPAPTTDIKARSIVLATGTSTRSQLAADPYAFADFFVVPI